MNPAILSLFTIAGSAVAAYYGAYFKKKGEDQALKEGFAEVLQRTKETTEATKKIEAAIGSDVWDRQKRWELKRDILLEAIKRLAALDDELSDFKSYILADKERSSQGPELDSQWSNLGVTARKDWQRRLGDFDETRYFVGTICSPRLKGALDSVAGFAHTAGAELAQGNIPEEPQSQTEFFTRLFRARLAIRKELGIDEPRSQSNESSAAPSLAPQAPK